MVHHRRPLRGTLWITIGELIARIQAEECINHLHNAGYVRPV